MTFPQPDFGRFNPDQLNSFCGRSVDQVAASLERRQRTGKLKLGKERELLAIEHAIEQLQKILANRTLSRGREGPGVVASRRLQMGAGVDRSPVRKGRDHQAVVSVVRQVVGNVQSRRVVRLPIFETLPGFRVEDLRSAEILGKHRLGEVRADQAFGNRGSSPCRCSRRRTQFVDFDAHDPRTTAGGHIVQQEHRIAHTRPEENLMLQTSGVRWVGFAVVFRGDDCESCVERLCRELAPSIRFEQACAEKRTATRGNVEHQAMWLLRMSQTQPHGDPIDPWRKECRQSRRCPIPGRQRSHSACGPSDSHGAVQAADSLRCLLPSTGGRLEFPPTGLGCRSGETFARQAPATAPRIAVRSARCRIDENAAREVLLPRATGFRPALRPRRPATRPLFFQREVPLA